MDAFKDEVYENMDDISKMIEPFEYEVNNELAQFPDEIELTPEMLIPGLVSHWDMYLNLDLQNIVYDKADELKLYKLRSEVRLNYSFSSKMFELQEVRDVEDEPLVFDAATGTLIGGKIVLVKKQIGVEDREIEDSMANFIHSYLLSSFGSASEADKKRLNELADLFGAKEARKERAWRNKVTKYAAHMKELVISKKIVIKDFELFKRFVRWNSKYIKDGSLPAFANITKIKIMMRSGTPIYSMKEEEV